MLIKSLKMNHKLEFVMIAIIIAISFFATTQTRDSTVNEVLLRDHDVEHLSLANNWASGDLHQISVAPVITQDFTTEKLMTFQPKTPNRSPWPPLYHGTLGGLNSLISPDALFLFIHASYFNTILNSLLLISLFFLIRKYFGNYVGFISCIILAISYTLIYHSVHISPRPLAYLLIVLSFFFLERKKSNYILFAVFAGLAHLSHMIAVVPAVSYIIFLLFHRDYKGSLLIFSIYTAILSPMMIHNLFTFGDFGRSLGIPESRFISELFGFTETIHRVEPLVSRELLFSDFFVSVSSEFQYRAMNTIEFLVILGAIGIIIITILSLLKNKNNFMFLKGIEKDKISLIHYSFFYIVIATLVWYWLSTKLDYIPSLRYFFPIFFLLVPIAVFLMSKILNNVISSKIKKSHFLVFTSIGLVLFIPAFYEMDLSIDAINEFNISNSLSKRIPKSETFHNWLVNNLPRDALVVTNHPRFFFLGTGLDAIVIPKDFHIYSDKFIDYYETKFIVLYNREFESLFYYFKNSDKYIFYLVHKTSVNERTHHSVFQIIDFDEFVEQKLSKLTKPYSYENVISTIFYTTADNISIQTYESKIVKAKNYEDSGNFEKSLEIYEELIEMDYFNLKNWEAKLRIHLILHETDKIFWTIDEKNKIINEKRYRFLGGEIPFIISDYHSAVLNEENRLLFIEIRYHENAGNLENIEPIIPKVLSLALEQLKLDTVSNSKQYKIYLKQLTILASTLEDESLEIMIYQRILDFDRWDVDAIYGLAHGYEKKGNYRVALLTYESLIPLVDDPTPIKEKVSELLMMIENSN